MIKFLLPFEKKWIAKRLEVYQIKYAEIYNEVYDHILSSCDEKRKEGDNRPVQILFQETIDQDFGSYSGLRRMSEERRNELKFMLKRSFGDGFGAYFSTSKLAILLVCWMAVFFLLDQTDMSPKLSLIVVFVLSVLPLVYLLIYGSARGYFRKVTSRRKTSLVNEMAFSLLSFPLMLTNGVMAILGLYDFFRGAGSFYLTFGDLIGSIGAIGMSFWVILVLTYCMVVLRMIRTVYDRLIKQIAQ